MAGQRGRAVVGQGAVLAVVVAIAAWGCGLWGAAQGFVSPWLAAGTAGVLNVVAGWLGLAAVLWASLRWPAHGAMVGVFVRMAIPLPIGLVLHRAGGDLATSRVFAMVLACYLVMLVTETLLVVRGLSRARLAAGTVDSGSA